MNFLFIAFIIVSPLYASSRPHSKPVALARPLTTNPLLPPPVVAVNSMTIRHGLSWSEADELIRHLKYNQSDTTLGISASSKVTMFPQNGFGLVPGCAFQSAIYYPRQWDIPKTALAAYPGSGLNWLRILLQKATGYLTSSTYPETPPTTNTTSDNAAFLSSFNSLGNSSNSTQEDSGEIIHAPPETNHFLVKTHFPLFIKNNVLDKFFPEILHQDFDRAIYLMRNPFDAIFTYFYRHEESLFVGRSKEVSKEPVEDASSMNGDFELEKDLVFTVPLGSISPLDIRNYVKGYLMHYQYWRVSTLASYPLKFETLQGDLKSTLENLVTYLVPMPKEAVTTLQQYHFRHMLRQKIECTLASNLPQEMGMITDLLNKENFSLKYYTKETLIFMALKLQAPICEYGYHSGINEILGSQFIDCS